MKKTLSILISLIILCMPSAVNASSPFLTREEAVIMITNMIKNKVQVQGEDKPFADTAEPRILTARKLGLVIGDADNNFMPEQNVKNQDFLIILKRAIDLAVPSIVYDNQKIVIHQDEAEIDFYAKSQIAFLTAIGIMPADRCCHPQEGITRTRATEYINMAKHAMDKVFRSDPTVENQKRVPVLMYHLIDTPAENTAFPYLFVTPEEFEKQIKYLYDNGYTFLFPEERNYAMYCKKPIILTFDDGYLDNYEVAMPILKKYRAKATLFMVSDLIGQGGYCDANQLKTMSMDGCFRIYAHTKTHRNMTELTPAEIENEFKVCNDTIYNITKRDVNCLSFPYGAYNDEVLKVAKKYYRSSFSVKHTKNTTFHSIPRITISNECTIDDFIRLIGA